MNEPATSAVHHLRELEDSIKRLASSRDTWMEQAAAKFDEGYERGYADAVTDFTQVAKNEDWHGKAHGSNG